MRTLGGGTLILVVAGGFLVSCHRAAPLPQLNIADSPVPRENRPELSLAPVQEGLVQRSQYLYRQDGAGKSAPVSPV
jgi:hypothetical protein